MNRALQSLKHMDIKRIIQTFTYRIEPKPEGGFIAHATDPTLPPLEAPTRTEMQEKIQARISAALSEQFPGLNLPVNSKELKFNFHVEAKPGGGFIIHSHNSDPNAAPVEGSTHNEDEIELPFAEKLLGALGKHFPELSQALAAQGSGDIKVFVNRTLTVTTSKGSHTLTLGKTQDPQPTGSPQLQNTNIAGTVNASNDSPITPEADTSWPIFHFLLAALIIAAIVYFVLHR